MKVFQWKYTACPFNMENANGFNTFSMSDGLTREDKEELVRFAGTYTPPDHLPHQPTSEELSKFPVAFSFFRLRTGRFAICRTCYVGRDYGGVRWGNFFSHALVLENGFWPFYPVELWNSPLFDSKLTPEEVTLGKIPPPLKILELDEVRETVSNGKTFETKGMKGMISGIMQAPVLFVGNGKNIISAVSAVQKSFPLELAHQLSFSTYVENVTSARRYRISVTLPEGTTLAKQLSEMAPQFAFFNIQTGESNVKKIFDFETMVTSAPARKQLVHELIREFKWTEVDESLEQVCPTARLFFAIPEDQKTLIDTLMTAKKRLSGTMLEKLLGRLLDRAGLCSLPIRQILAQFFLSAVRQIHQQKTLSPTESEHLAMNVARFVAPLSADIAAPMSEKLLAETIKLAEEHLSLAMRETLANELILNFKGSSQIKGFSQNRLEQVSRFFFEVLNENFDPETLEPNNAFLHFLWKQLSPCLDELQTENFQEAFQIIALIFGKTNEIKRQYAEFFLAAYQDRVFGRYRLDISLCLFYLLAFHDPETPLFSKENAGNMTNHFVARFQENPTQIKTLELLKQSFLPLLIERCAAKEDHHHLLKIFSLELEKEYNPVEEASCYNNYIRQVMANEEAAFKKEAEMPLSVTRFLDYCYDQSAMSAATFAKQIRKYFDEYMRVRVDVKQQKRLSVYLKRYKQRTQFPFIIAATITAIILLGIVVLLLVMSL